MMDEIQVTFVVGMVAGGLLMLWCNWGEGKRELEKARQGRDCWNMHYHEMRKQRDEQETDKDKALDELAQMRADFNKALIELGDTYAELERTRDARDAAVLRVQGAEREAERIAGLEARLEKDHQHADLIAKQLDDYWKAVGSAGQQLTQLGAQLGTCRAAIYNSEKIALQITENVKILSGGIDGALSKEQA